MGAVCSRSPRRVDVASGARPPTVGELSRVSDRHSFVYLEHAVINRDASAITATDSRGTVHVPAAALAAILLGPGCSLSHGAAMLLAESGTTAVWVGEQGVRYYAHGRSLAQTTRLLDAQAHLVTHRDRRLGVARAMYAMRFPGEDVSYLSMQQLRGREGARVRRVYNEQARRTGVEWTRRDYDAADFGAGSPINQALSAANSALYGLAHAVIVGLGASPGLGFVHTGHERSFVYDIADLYKAELSIPVAFETTAEGEGDLASRVRRRMRDAIYTSRTLERCAHDVRHLLVGTDTDVDEGVDTVIDLWDERLGRVAGGVAYGLHGAAE